MQERFRIIWEVIIVVTVFVTGMLAPMVLAVGAQGFEVAFVLLSATFIIDFIYKLYIRRPQYAQPRLGGVGAPLGQSRRWMLIDLLATVSILAATAYLFTSAGPAPTGRPRSTAE